MTTDNKNGGLRVVSINGYDSDSSTEGGNNNSSIIRNNNIIDSIPRVNNIETQKNVLQQEQKDKIIQSVPLIEKNNSIKQITKSSSEVLPQVEKKIEDTSQIPIQQEAIISSQPTPIITSSPIQVSSITQTDKINPIKTEVKREVESEVKLEPKLEPKSNLDSNLGSNSGSDANSDAGSESGSNSNSNSDSNSDSDAGSNTESNSDSDSISDINVSKINSSLKMSGGKKKNIYNEEDVSDYESDDGDLSISSIDSAAILSADPLYFRLTKFLSHENKNVAEILSSNENLLKNMNKNLNNIYKALKDINETMKKNIKNRD